MRRLLLIIFTISLINIAFGQEDPRFVHVVDSIEGFESPQAQIEALHDVATRWLKKDKEYARALSNEILRRSEKAQFKAGLADGYYNLGVISMFGPFPEALDNLMKAFDLYTELGDQLALANTWATAAIVYQGMDNKDKAINALRKAENFAVASKNKKVLSRVHTNYTAIYHYFDQIDSSLYHSKIALGLKREIGDDYGLLRALMNLGVISSNFDSLLDEGLVYLLEARELAEGDPLMISDIVTNLVYVYARKKEFQVAELYLDSALVGHDSLQNDYTLQGLYKEAKDMYEQRREYEKAYYYANLEYALDEKLRGAEVQEQFEILQLENQNEKKQREIAELERETTQSKFRLVLLLLALAVMIIVGVPIYLKLKSRIKQSAISEKKLKYELDHKNKELASYTLNFVQKNEIISNIKEQVKELSKRALPEENKKFQQINKVIDESFRADKEWENFKFRFEEVHEGFFKNLQANYADLSNAELRLCALLRLNMNLKESSQILGIAPDSVKTARYRLRKKLGLAKEENLVKFMASIEDA